MIELAERIGSESFAQLARHPDSPNAFTRTRKLPLPGLSGALLSMRNQSQQTTVDAFFASVCVTPSLTRELSELVNFSTKPLEQALRGVLYPLVRLK